MRIVLYSVAMLGSTHCERQWTASIRSLRRYNPNVHVRLSLFGEPARETLAEAERQRVEVVFHGPYHACFSGLSPVRAEALARHPCLHRVLSFGALPEGPGQVLYLDCDTYCFGDIEAVFARYGHRHLFAREEPGSRRSPHGYDPSYIDEDALAALAAQCGVAFVPPYNAGVVMMNGGLWRRLAELYAEFLDRIWRLSPERPDGAPGLAYPSSNAWIIDEVALWLTLGRFPDLTHGAFDPGDVAQNGEFRDRLAQARPPWLAHYYTSWEDEFFRALEDHEAGLPIA
jgi:hypothetical protein